MTGLTIDQLLAAASDLVPTEKVGELLRRLPAKYYDPETRLFRPVAPAVMHQGGGGLHPARDQC